MQHDFLRIEETDRVVTWTLAREARRNALHGPLWTALGEEARRLAADPPRALILTGAGGHFAAGMDLKPDNPLVERLFPALATRDEASFRALLVELKGVVGAIAAIPCPVVAAIEGACAGGGLELALACDFRLAGRGAFFSLPEARAGMMPDVGGTIRLARLIGRARAAELILTNGRIDAAVALSFGLINRLAEEGRALEAARSFVEELASSAPTATREVLRVLRLPNPTLEDETEAGIRVLCSGEAEEGIRAFIEKRPPRWSARDRRD